MLLPQFCQCALFGYTKSGFPVILPKCQEVWPKFCRFYRYYFRSEAPGSRKVLDTLSPMVKLVGKVLKSPAPPSNINPARSTVLVLIFCNDRPRAVQTGSSSYRLRLPGRVSSQFHFQEEPQRRRSVA